MEMLNKYPTAASVEEALDKGLAAYNQSEQNETDILSVKEELSTINSVVGITWIDRKFISASGTQLAGDNTRKCTDYIVCNENTSITYVSETNHQNVCGISFYDAHFKFISGEVNVGDAGTEITTISPVGTYYCRLSTKRPIEAKIKFEKSQLADTVGKLSSRIEDIKKAEIAYVSTDGSDNNDGTTSSPYATVNKALESGAKIVGVYGGRYKQTIDLSKATSPKVEIRCMQDTKRVIFESPDCVLGTSESLVSGYTKVYRIETSVSIADDNKWIYQDGVADETTLISDAERHPLERGYTYRCEDTKIVRCKSTTVDEALSEIESSDTYKWYLDSNNGVLYLSRPQVITTDNPLCYSSGTNLFANLSRKLSLKLVGIETKYLVFNTMLISSAEILDCKAANVFGAGAFRYDRCQNAMFVRCEAVRCRAGNNGDGFNGHSLSTGDIYSKQTNVTLFDCYSHDNQDDGYSDHERSEITIIGGLYEYNGKGGVTPSYGSHCTCYNVHSRNNFNGFYYTGNTTEAEGGKYGQMVCHNCVAENNRVGDSSIKAGFVVDGAGNTMMLVGCKSINNKYGYYVGSDTASATLIDCTGLDNEVIKFGNSVTIKNTAVVTE